MQDTKKRAQTGSRVLLAGLGFLLLLMGGGFCGVLWNGFQKANRTRSWTQAKATVVSAWIEQPRWSRAGDPRYVLQIRYRYEIGGKTWVSRQVTQRDAATRYRERKEKSLRKYRPGSEHICFVNPANPSEAVLKHDTRAPGYTLWFPGLFVVGGAGMMVAAWRGARFNEAGRKEQIRI